MRNPCKKDCPDRTATCHAECEKYLEYFAYCEERRNKHIKQHPIHQYIKDSMIASRKGKR